MKRVLTAKQLIRFKFIAGAFMFCLLVTYSCNYVAAQMEPYKG